MRKFWEVKYQYLDDTTDEYVEAAHGYFQTIEECMAFILSNRKHYDIKEVVMNKRYIGTWKVPYTLNGKD